MTDQADCGAPRPSRRSILAACLALPSLAYPGRAARKVPPAALLVPLSGPRAALGRSMARAAALAQGRDSSGLVILDSGAGAAAGVQAAQTALKRGAGLILGPLESEAVRPVLAAVAGRVPVVTFSNDESLRESGAFLLGITADQSVGAVCHYARGRGLRRIAVGDGGGAWGAQVAAAARRAAEREGLQLVAASAQPDGLLIASADARPSGRNTQLLCAFGAGEAGADAIPSLEGAWLASPDPSAFSSFSSGFEAANGAPPGLIAGLAYDAVAMAVKLRQGGGTDRSAILAPAGFAGVCGAFRFRDDGSASRDLAVFAIERGSYRVIDHPRENATSR